MLPGTALQVGAGPPQLSPLGVGCRRGITVAETAHGDPRMVLCHAYSKHGLGTVLMN